MREQDFRRAFLEGVDQTRRALTWPPDPAGPTEFTVTALAATADALEGRPIEALADLLGEPEAPPRLDDDVRTLLGELLDPLWKSFEASSGMLSSGAHWAWVERTRALVAVGSRAAQARAHHLAHLDWFDALARRDALEALLLLNGWPGWRSVIALLGAELCASSTLRVLETADFWLQRIERQPPYSPKRPGETLSLARCVRGLARVFADGGQADGWYQHAERLWPEVMTRAQARALSELLRPYWSASRGLDSMRTFEELPLALISKTGFLDTPHNAAPSAREVLDRFGWNRMDVTVGGYLVSPPRLDARLSLHSLAAPRAEVPEDWRATADEVVEEPDERLYLWFD